MLCSQRVQQDWLDCCFDVCSLDLRALVAMIHTANCLRSACSNIPAHRHLLSLLRQSNTLCRTSQISSYPPLQPDRQQRAMASGSRHDAHPQEAMSSEAEAGHHKYTNALAEEQSPYLLQHAHNPVDWLPWSEEAFAKARNENKPIFLSVGYATCHWCHVMERESFESEDVAELLNKSFVSIKVDREERPDVDKMYMTYTQATSGGGGWPMSVFMTPDLKPFYAGTYFPKVDSYGMPSFSTVLRRIKQLWDTRRNEIQQQSSSTMQQLQDAMVPDGPPKDALHADVAAAAATAAAEQLAKRFDDKLGGFGGVPKFPRPSEINALLAAYLQTTKEGKQDSKRAQKYLHMAMFTLERMAAGGIFDHLGGGFHRYSVDEYWHVPHFEKMLYDNPQLASTYLSAFQLASALEAAGNPGEVTSQELSLVVRGILDYLRRDMTHPEGGLYSAEDADSFDTEVNEKREGAFYVWKAAEIEEVLGPERAREFNKAYMVEPEGNTTLSPRSDPHHEFDGKNVLMRADKPAGAKGSDPNGEQMLAECRRLLYERRAQRPRPSLDDKIVTAWNGMGISSFACASRVLASESPPAQPLFPVEGCSPATYLEAAVKVAQFVRANLWDEDRRRLRRAYCKAPSAVEGFADDYAHMIAGLLDLYEAGGGTEWLQWAAQLQDSMDELFWDAEHGGYYGTSGTDASIALRMKEDYDGAEPAASSIAVSNLVRLAGLLPSSSDGSIDRDAGRKSGTDATTSGRGDVWMQCAQRCLAAFEEQVARMPIAVPQMCASAALLASAPLRQVIIAGDPSDPKTQALLDAAHAPFAPDKVIILINPKDPASTSFWESANPEAAQMVLGRQQPAGAASEAGSAGTTAAAGTAAAGASSSSGPQEGVGGQGSAQAAEQGSGSTEMEPTAYVCQNFACQAPTSNPDKVRQLLQQQRRAAGSVKLDAMQWPAGPGAK